MSTANCWPGEKFEDRVEALLAGREPDRGAAFRTLQKHAKAEAWLGHQMLQTSTKTPLLEPSYMVPDWARFFVNKADRAREDPEATVADRLNWAKLSTKTRKAGNAHCTQLTLPFFVTTEKLNE
eukprot:146906-Pyramimonas_sp.AAC.1